METSVSIATYNRLPIYLKALHYMQKKGQEYVSSVALADAVRENSSVVKKDLSCVITCVGKPKIGYGVAQLIEDLEAFLGYNNVKDAIIVGVGKLGQALMSYGGFKRYGLDIVAGFDVNDKIIGKKINGKTVMPTGKIESTVEKLKIKLAILSTPQEYAQQMADLLAGSGIRAIWNFTSTHLSVPDTVTVKNEDLAADLAILAMQLKEILRKESDL